MAENADYVIALKINGMSILPAPNYSSVVITDPDKPGGGAPFIQVNVLADNATPDNVKAAAKVALEQALALL